MKRQLLFVLSASAFLASAAHAADVAPCATIRYQPDRVYTISARLHHTVHIILPESIVGSPVVGNADLWDADGESTHLFIKPTNADSPDGAATTMTAIGQSNTAYDFEVRRVSSGGDVCVRILKDSKLISSDSDWKSPEERRLSSLQSEVQRLREQLSTARSDGEQRALAAVREYQTRIYTQYTWSKGKGFLGEEVVSDVWDDGRFTYVRVHSDNKGLMQISAKVDGKKELIEYDYDSNRKIYTLAGLYPELTLAYGKSSIDITRADNKSAG